MSDEPRWPLDERQRRNIRGVVDKIKELDGLVGGWTSKSDCRQTGLSLHIRFDKKVDVMTTIEFMNFLELAPGLLRDACERLLAAAEAQE